MVIIHSPRCLEYAAAGHPESPERVRSAVALLHKDFHTWIQPEPCSEADILRVHTPHHLAALQTGQFADADTPHFPNIYELARLSAGAAILAAEKALTGQLAFSMMRPPGHHAERERIMGFCYLNNIAIAVARILDPSAPRSVERAAVLDFDCHHGNGTEDIFRGNERVLFASIHQSPCYPATGLESRGNCLNYPLPPGTEEREFLVAVDGALEKFAAFRPAVLAVSAGFDAYHGDPITQMGLDVEAYYQIGNRIAGFCRAPGTQTPLPCFAVLEGGYSRDFARCVEAFVHGWAQH